MTNLDGTEVRRLKEISNTISLFRRFIPANDITQTYYKKTSNYWGIKVLKKWGLVGDSEDGSFLTLKDSKIQLTTIRVKSNITYHIERQVY